jgi:hypothetical protein
MNKRILHKEQPSRIRRPLSPSDPDVLELRRILPGTLAKVDAAMCTHLAKRCAEVGLDDLARQAYQAAERKGAAMPIAVKYAKAVASHQYWSLGGGGPNPLDPNQNRRVA